MAAATEPLDLDDIDHFGDWAAKEQPSQFTEDEIYELEKEAMEEGGFAVILDDIQEEGSENEEFEDSDSEHSDNEDEDDEESLPEPTPTPPQTTATARATRPRPSPTIGMGKRKM